MAGVKQITPMHKGFTIIEVMIFLAISGFTFLIAASFINGKEAQAEFTTGMNSSNSVIRTMINNVADGNYPLSASVFLSCNISSGAPVIGLTSVPTTTPGCTLIGKVIAPETNGDNSLYSIYSVAGCQFFANNSCTTSQGLPPTTLTQEQPTVASSLTQSNNWPGGLTISKLLLINGANTQSIGAFGVFSSLPQNSGGVLVSGAQSVGAVFVNYTQLSTNTNSSIAGLVHNASTWLPSGSYIIMCLSGANGHKGSITIGGVNGGGQLTTTLQMGNTTAAQC